MRATPGAGLAAAAAAAGAGAAAASLQAVRQACFRIGFLLDAFRIEEARQQLNELQLPDVDGRQRLFRAILAFHDKKFLDCIEHAEYAIHVRRGHWPAYTVAAKAYIALGDFRSASATLDLLDGEHEEQKEVEHEVQERLARARVCGKDMRAYIAQLTGKFRESKGQIKAGKAEVSAEAVAQLAKECPHFDAVHTLRLEALLVSKQYAVLLEHARGLDPITRSSSSAIACVGIALLHQGHVAKALDEFRSDESQSQRCRSYAGRIDDVNRYVVTARNALAQGKFVEAKAAAMAAAQVDPYLPAFLSDSRCVLAEIELVRPDGDPKAASRLAREAIQFNRLNRDAFLVAADVHIAAMQLKEAIVLLEAALKIAPNDPAVTAKLARVKQMDALATSTHYKVLNVEMKATEAQIRQAYRKAMLRYHPDRIPPTASAAVRNLAAENAKRINAALEVLVDPLKRQLYDLTLGDDGDFLSDLMQDDPPPK